MSTMNEITGEKIKEILQFPCTSLQIDLDNAGKYSGMVVGMTGEILVMDDANSLSILMTVLLESLKEYYRGKDGS